MTFDLSTLLAVALLVVLMTTSACLLAWLQDRRDLAMLDMALANLAIGGGALARAVLPAQTAVPVGNCGILIACGLIWSASRRMQSSTRLAYAPPPLLPTGLLPLIALPFWGAACLLPEAVAGINPRMLAGNLLVLGLLVGALQELRATMRERTPAEWWLCALFGFAILFVGYRVAHALFAPQAAEAGPPEAGSAFVPTILGGLVFMLLASFGMVSMARERAERRHQNDARLDALTGLGNRRAFDEALWRLFARSRRRGRPLSLLLIDIDTFKAYNDRYGHPEGDACLRAVGRALARALHGIGLALRYGGEEFAVLLPGSGTEAALEVAERLRLAVRALDRPHAGAAAGVVTISLGLATAPARGGATPAGLVNAADRALYRAKREGRDRVCHEERPAAPEEAGEPRVLRASKLPG
ncbi:GGDEF domain-containing protein [Roseomonas sp. NAR14]|uniref:diguanylate cyclase n=1 Tax=Roseomonas acroporae TaxID=2937791 RepID=A0A9X1Y5X7_9PROT|nr:GGDEF domain-containing protein [Roseomonas acroporae]MCK8784053.1 GGDEF domain-containing protein [Roseomonas acroporae]